MQIQGQMNDRPKQSNPSLPWVQKYRPHTLEQLISHKSILSTLRAFAQEGNLPNLLFYGPPGTGKTSTIVALARQLYGRDFKSMVMELNASDERGIGVVREEIKKFADTKALSNNRNLKMIILDEADMMTNAAQFALRRIIQKYHTNARFCLISNYVSKIIPALQSRCTRFKFKQVSFEDAKPRIEEICHQEKLKVTPGAIEAVFRLCAGDMRRVVNMLQSLSLIDTTNEIDSSTVYEFTGSPSPGFLGKVMDILFNEEIQTAQEQIGSSLKTRGIALQTILKFIYLMLLERRMPPEQLSFLVNRLGDIEVSKVSVILEGNQSCSIEKETKVRRVYINKMSKGKELFSSLMTRVQAQEGLQEILKIQVDRYQIQPLKLEHMDCASIENLYSSLEFKYLESHELVEDPETWNDNQKKLFIWVIIFYAYFQEQQGFQLSFQTWVHLSPLFFNKNPQFLYFQYLNLIKPIGKITWTPEEDALLSQAVAEAGEGHWNEVSRWYFNESKYQMFKSPKHCRERWLNHLDNKKKKGNWTPEEDLVIFRFVAENGKRWCKLVPILKETRTEHMIKNRFNSLLNRQKQSRRDNDDHLITKIIRQLKKQISNLEKKKQKKEEVLKHEQEKEETLPKPEVQPKNEEIDEAPFYKQIEEHSAKQGEKESHTPASIESTPKKEASQEQTYIVPEVQRMPEMPFYPMPAYYPSIQDYPFLYQQQMQYMQYYMSYPPYKAY